MKGRVNWAVAYSIAGRLWTAAYGLVLLYLIATRLPTKEAGYYFSFINVAALQILFELGFSSVMIQFISHEVGERPGALNAGAANARSRRLSLLISVCIKWYKVAASIFVIVALPLGALFFQSIGVLGFSQWFFPWAALVIFTGLQVYSNAGLVALEGLGEVGSVARIRLAQTVASSVVAAALLVGGGGLYAIAGQAAASAFVALFSTRRFLMQSSVATHWSELREIFMELFPLQWRTALSWFSGYFISQLFVPATLKISGPEAAGKLGLTLAITNQLTMLSLPWISTKVPAIAQAIAAKNYLTSDTIFSRAFRFAAGSFVAMATGFLLVLMVANFMKLEATGKLENFQTIAACMAAAFGTQIVFSQAYFLRAHKKEPYLKISIVWAFAAVFSCVVQSLTHSTFWMFVFYSLSVWIMIVPWSSYMMRNYPSRWRAEQL